MRTMTLQTQTPGGKAQPIPVEKERKACERMLAICDWATFAPWRDAGYGAIRGGPLQEYTNGSADDQVALVTLPNRDEPTKVRDANAAFIVAARATMRPLVEYVAGAVKRYGDTVVMERDYLYAPLAAIIQHLDSTEPGWEGR